MSPPLTLCVLLWPHDGRQDDLVDYEDQVLGLVAGHGGHLLQRVRAEVPTDGPYEVQVLQFPSQAALDAYLDDPARQALTAARHAAIARTEIQRVTVV